MSNNVRWSRLFRGQDGKFVRPGLGARDRFFKLSVPGGHSAGPGARGGFGAALVVARPQPTPQNLAILSRAWKWNLHLHAGYGSTAGGSGWSLFGFRQLDALHGFVAVLCLLAWFAGALVLLAYATWYWVRIYPRIGPLWDKVSTPVLSDRAIGQMADVAGFMAGTLESFDESASTARGGFRRWRLGGEFPHRRRRKGHGGVRWRGLCERQICGPAQRARGNHGRLRHLRRHHQGRRLPPRPQWRTMSDAFFR